MTNPCDEFGPKYSVILSGREINMMKRIERLEAEANGLQIELDKAHDEYARKAGMYAATENERDFAQKECIKVMAKCGRLRKALEDCRGPQPNETHVRDSMICPGGGLRIRSWRGNNQGSGNIQGDCPICLKVVPLYGRKDGYANLKAHTTKFIKSLTKCSECGRDVSEHLEDELGVLDCPQPEVQEGKSKPTKMIGQ